MFGFPGAELAAAGRSPRASGHRPAAGSSARQPARRLRPGHQASPARATACAIRRSPNSRSAPCSKNLGIATEGGSRAPERRRRHRHRQHAPYVQSGARIDIDVLDGRRHLACRRHADHDAAEGGGRRIYARRPEARSSFPASRRTGRAMTQGVPTAGRVPNGAIVERAVRPSSMTRDANAAIAQSDFLDRHSHIADAISDFTSQRWHAGRASAFPHRQIKRPKGYSAAASMPRSENLVVRSTPARSSSTSTPAIVIGNDVKISGRSLWH